MVSIAGAGGIGYFVWSRYKDQFGKIRLGGESDGPSLTTGSYGLRRSLGGAISADSPLVRWPIMGISAVVAGVMALPMLVTAVWRKVRGPGGGYGRVGGGSRGWSDENRRGLGVFGGRTSASPRTYTSRSSFARGSYSTVGAEDERDLLGEEGESDEEI